MGDTKKRPLVYGGLITKPKETEDKYILKTEAVKWVIKNSCPKGGCVHYDGTVPFKCHYYITCVRYWGGNDFMIKKQAIPIKTKEEG